jgi:hypothetical protein
MESREFLHYGSEKSKIQPLLTVTSKRIKQNILRGPRGTTRESGMPRVGNSPREASSDSSSDSDSSSSSDSNSKSDSSEAPSASSSPAASAPGSASESSPPASSSDEDEEAEEVVHKKKNDHSDNNNTKKEKGGSHKKSRDRHRRRKQKKKESAEPRAHRKIAPGHQMAHEFQVFQDEVLRTAVEAERREGDELFAETCVPWLLPCVRGHVLEACRACVPCGCFSCAASEKRSRGRVLCCSCCPTPYVADEEAALTMRAELAAEKLNAKEGDEVDLLAVAAAELYPKFLYTPLHGTAMVMTRRWFKWVTAGVAVCSLPVFLVLAAVLGASIFMTLLIVVQFMVFIFLFPRTCVACLKLYTHMRPYHLLCGCGSILATILMTAGLSAIPWKPLMWSYLDHVSLGDDEDGDKTNLIEFGFVDIVPAILYTLLILLVLPVAAWFEEVIFRAGTKNWRWGLLRSFIFGIIHLTMGVPLILNFVPLPIMGMWFTREYFEGMRRYVAADRAREYEAGRAPALTEGGNTDPPVVALDDIPTCSWLPWSIGPWSGHAIPEAEEWKTSLHIETGQWYYKNKVTGKNYWYPPVPIRARAAGVRAAALVHLAHNFLAIVVTAVVYVINATSGSNVKV